MKKIQIINGIEGDDIPYHLHVLGFDKIQTVKDTFFVSLNDHYGLHTDNWLSKIQAQAGKCSKIVFYDLVNTGDDYHDAFCSFIKNFNHPNKIYLTNNFSKKFALTNVQIVRWDFMWNRVKLYYTGAQELTGAFADPLLHHYAGKEKYKLNSIKFDSTREKTFLNLCGRGYGYRNILYEFLEQYKTIGYRSMRSAGIHLEKIPAVGAYVPVPNDYYDNSYISIYVESNCVEPELIHITEKTFEPLIKGHFILPFANPGTIKRIQELGFLLPEFIDYSYDTIIDAEQRFNKYTEVIDNIINLNWPELYKQHQDLILHNRQQLFKLDYDRSILGLFDE